MPDRRLGVALGLALLSVLASPWAFGGRAQAHAQLVTSSPGAGEVLVEAPPEVRLTFSEPVEEGFVSLDVTDAAGVALVEDAGNLDPADPTVVVAPLPDLTEGVYTVEWRNLSAADGHGASGFFSFGVGDVTGVPTAEGAAAGRAPLDPLGWLPRWATYAGLLPAFGLALFAAFVLRPPLVHRSLRVLLAGLLGLAAAASLAGGLSGALAAGSEPLGYLVGSRTGLLATARAGVLAAGCVLVLVGPRPAIGAALAALGGIVLLAAAGHAAVAGAVGVAFQAVHVAAAGVWLGGLVGLSLLAWRPALLGAVPGGVAAAVPRFSAFAIVAIGLVAMTGAYASWTQTGRLVSTDTDWGVALLVKVSLAAAALGLGGYHYTRAAARPASIGATLLSETGLALLVLGATAVLSGTPPTEGARGVALEPVPSALGEVVSGVTTEVLPGRPGANRIVVAVEGALGERPAELVLRRLDASGESRVPLTYAGSPAAGTGHTGHGAAGGGHDAPADADHYLADAVALPPGSSWDASVRIMGSDGAELLRQRYVFALDDDGIERGVASTGLDIGLVIAGLLGAGGAVAVGLGAGGASLPRTDSALSRLTLLGGGAISLILAGAVGGSRLLGG